MNQIASLLKTHQISTHAHAEPVELSSAQQRVLYLCLMKPNSALYNLSVQYKLHNDVDCQKLAKAVDSLVCQHEVFSARLVSQGEGEQAITFDSPKPVLSVERVDRSLFDDTFNKASNEPFDFYQGPLVRFQFVESEGVSCLQIVAHALVFDRPALSLCLSTLFQLYKELDTNTTDLKPGGMTEAFPFKNYLTLLSNDICDGYHSADLSFWLNHIESPVEPLSLPLDKSRPPISSFEAVNVPLSLDDGLTVKLMQWADSHQVKLPTVLLTAFKILLARYSNQSTVMVGVSANTRRQSELYSEALAPLSNILPIQSNIDTTQSVVDYTRYLQQELEVLEQHTLLRLDHLLKELNIQRDLSQSPLFQSLFCFDESVEITSRDEVLARLPSKESFCETDIDLIVLQHAQGLFVEFKANKDVFETTTVEQFASHWKNMLVDLVQKATPKIYELSIMSDAEFQQVCHEWNATDLPIASDSVLELVHQQCLQQPNKVAISCNGNSISYQQLWQSVCTLSTHIQSKGVCQHDIVGISLPRNEWLPIAVLATLQAGASYMPLDPNYPLERLHYMLEQSKAGFVLTTHDIADNLEFSDDQTIFLPSVEQLERHNLTSASLSEVNSKLSKTAYIIYTSGSTGKPKGVMISHASMTNFLVSMQQQPGFSAEDHLASVTTLSFDISVLELFLPLISGGRVTVVPENISVDGIQLAALLESNDITLMQATPSTWRLLLSIDWQGKQNLKALCGGEPLSRSLVEQLVPRVEGLWNMYGPTETTVWSTCQLIEHVDAPIRIGKPIANTRLYVLNDDLQLQPAGVCGELYIGGQGVSQGYLGREDLTTERFLDNPWIAGEKIYKTGDVVRFQADGILDCLGRADRQVKLRGFRIEMGEVEAVIVSHDAIEEAAAHVHDLDDGDQRLVAYVVVEEDEDVLPTELRRHIKNALPSYMTPQHFVFLDKLPLTPNGKIDRKQLPLPESLAPAQTCSEPPSSEMEKYIASIWGDALNVSSISKTDSFVDHGGHSLLAMKAIARIKQDKGADLNPGLFLVNTLEQVAAELNRRLAI